MRSGLLRTSRAYESWCAIRVPFNLTGDRDRERALCRSLISTHAILTVQHGEWLSLADPPAGRDRGRWPRHAATPGSGRSLWAIRALRTPCSRPRSSSRITRRSPPESSGDLFDATEIDEILSLRILALTDDEKAEMRTADPRSRALLDRTEALTGEDLMRMHGTIREIHPATRERR